MVIIVGVVVVRNISTADKREHASTGTSRGSAVEKVRISRCGDYATVLVTLEEVPGWFVVLELRREIIDQSCCQYLCRSLATKPFGEDVVSF